MVDLSNLRDQKVLFNSFPMFLIDKFFSGLPVVIMVYYAIKTSLAIINDSTDRIDSYICFRNSFIMLLISNTLKQIFKIQRRQKTLPFKPWIPKKHLELKLRSFGFPSNHTMLYVSLYLENFNYIFLVISVIGTLMRVFAEHHTMSEVVITVEICISIRTVFDSLFSNVCTLELKILLFCKILSQKIFEFLRN